MSHAPDCDLMVYGAMPNATGVVCTCDQDDGDDDGPMTVAIGELAANGPVETLQGDAALALRRFRKAAGDLQRAQTAHARALAEFTSAVAK